MTKKTTIVLFYCGVAVVCAAILAIVNLLIVPRIKAKGQEAELFTNIGHTEEKSWFPIAKDLTGTIQTGEEVKLSDLRGKVWVVVEFFAVCPHCAARNGAEVKRIYEEFKDHPDFQVVCISVDPTEDNTEKLSDYASALGAEAEDWWFLNAGDEQTTHDYLEHTLGFLGIRERTDPEDIEANGRFKHDMGILLVNRDFNVIGKWPLTDERDAEEKKLNPELFEARKADLMRAIRTELEKNESN